MEIQSQVQTFELMFQFTGKTTKKTHIPVHVSQNLNVIKQLLSKQQLVKLKLNLHIF